MRRYPVIATCLLMALAACDDDPEPVDAGLIEAGVDAALDAGPDPDLAPAPDADPDQDPEPDQGPEPDAAPDGDPPCAPGELRPFVCPDGQEVPWCTCDDAGVFQCVDSPENACRDASCDDGEPIACPQAEPECEPGSIPAARDGCWACVDPETCRPWGEPGCATDADCPADAWCDDCAHGSCPACEDCVADCRPHGCPTDPEPACDEARPVCGPAGVAVVADGCWICVDRATCEPAAMCVPEGGSTPVVPDAPPCCPGLEPIGCGAPVDGACEPCVGASVCARCGDGLCGPGENICNCPDDCAGAEPDGCAAPIDCLPRFWNVRCLGHWICEAGACAEVCDFDGCGDGICDHEGGESASSCSADCDGVAECAPGERTTFACPDGEAVPWCECDDAAEWRCALDPGAACRDARCDDGSPPICDRIPPVCEAWEILAEQDGCYRCVNPATCRPWGEPGCHPEDAPCPPDRICDDCGSSSCPDCDDCVPACVPAR